VAVAGIKRDYQGLAEIVKDPEGLPENGHDTRSADWQEPVAVGGKVFSTGTACKRAERALRSVKLTSNSESAKSATTIGA